MLMFDNAIFATFIPQILMVLGFILCIAAPKFTPKTSTNFETFAEVKVIPFLAEIKQEKNVAHFFQHQITEKNSKQIKFQEYFSTTPKIIKINYPDLAIRWREIEFISSLFSRPPPFSI